MSAGQNSVAITLDLENNWNFERSDLDYLTFEYLDEYISLIRSLDLPLTVFVVGRTLEERPEDVERLRTALDCEFQLHSYSHDLTGSADFHREITFGVNAFEDFFGDSPEGYRAPRGMISNRELRSLDRSGFDFDSSIFPSYRPGIYNNLDAPTSPYVPDGVDSLLEIPFAVHPWLRIPISQSYLKLLGRPYLRSLRLCDLPQFLVFDSHLQDFYRTAAHGYLDQPRKFAYARNLDRSTTLFRRFIELISNAGHEFVTMSELYREVVS